METSSPPSAAPHLTPWGQYRQRRAAAPPRPVSNPRRDWTWNYTNSGHEGVHTYEYQLVWYVQPMNPHAGEAACSQSLADFLANGPPPPLALPSDDVRDGVYDAVKELLRLGAQ